jgi:hypothetical protein
MEPTPSEAAELLASADTMRGRVSMNAARESRAFLGWSAFVLVMLPPFDVLDGAIWGPVILVVSLAGWFATTRYYHRRTERVRLDGYRRWRLVWVAWGAYYGGLVLAAQLLDSRVGFIWTVVALVAALPLLAFGLHLARQER